MLIKTHINKIKKLTWVRLTLHGSLNLYCVVKCEQSRVLLRCYNYYKIVYTIYSGDDQAKRFLNNTPYLLLL